MPETTAKVKSRYAKALTIEAARKLAQEKSTLYTDTYFYIVEGEYFFYISDSNISNSGTVKERYYNGKKSSL